MAPQKKRKAQTLPTDRDVHKQVETPIVAADASYLQTIPKRGLSGDTKATLSILSDLANISTAGIKEMKVKGSAAFIRGDARPEGWLSGPNQEGYDYTKAQAAKGSVFAEHSKKMEALSAAYNGRNPEEFRIAVAKLTKKTIHNATDKQSNAYLAGSQNTIVELQNSTAVFTEKIIKDKLAEVCSTDITGIVIDRIGSIYRTDYTTPAEQGSLSPKELIALNRKRRAFEGKAVLEDMQGVGLEKFESDKNTVTSIIAKAITPAGKDNAALFELFYVPDASGIKPKNTPGGAGIEKSYLAAIENEKKLAPMRAYKMLKSMPQFKNVDGTLKYAEVLKYLGEPESIESLNLEGLDDVNALKGFIGRSYLEDEQLTKKAKTEYTTKTLNIAFDILYKDDVRNVNDFISYVKSSELDGLLKDRIIKGAETNSKTGSSIKFNEVMGQIWRKEVVLPEEIAALMGHSDGVTYDEGKELISYLKLVNEDDYTQIDMARKELYNSMTHGGMTLDDYSPVVQAAYKRAFTQLIKNYRELKKAGKEVNWEAEVDKVRLQNVPRRSDEMSALTDARQRTQSAVDYIKYIDQDGTALTIGKGKTAIKVSPGLTGLKAFIVDVVTRQAMREKTTVPDAAGIAEMLKDSKRLNWLQAQYVQYLELQKQQLTD